MKISNKIKTISLPIIGFLIGIIAFIIIFPISALNPQNLSTIFFENSLDIAEFFQGWHLFRKKGWTWPLGLINPDTFETTSIVFTDSIPIVAILLKLINNQLPEIFQYRGLWLLLCYGLQGFFSTKLLRSWGCTKTISLIGSCFFILSPTLFQRAAYIPHTLHTTLAAHWVILAALYLYNQNQSRYKSWSFLLLLTTSIHFYLLCMIIPIWLAHIIKQQRLNPKKNWAAAVQIISLLFLIVTWMYALGYFVHGYTAYTKILGYYSNNLLSFFNPAPYNTLLLPVKLAQPLQYEGFNYLGLGILIMLGAALILITKKKTYLIKTHLPLLLCTITLWILSLSPTITIADYTLFKLKLPLWIHNLWSIVTSSGRLAWPVGYLIMTFSIVAIQKKTQQKVALSIISGCLLIQILDLQIFFKRYNNTPPPISLNLSKKWEALVKNKNQINIGFTDYTSMSVNNYAKTIYLSLKYKKPLAIARTSHTIRSQLVPNKKIYQTIKSNHFNEDTLYIITNSKDWIKPAINNNKSEYLIDNLYVINEKKGLKDIPSPPFQLETTPSKENIFHLLKTKNNNSNILVIPGIAYKHISPKLKAYLNQNNINTNQLNNTNYLVAIFKNNQLCINEICSLTTGISWEENKTKFDLFLKKNLKFELKINNYTAIEFTPKLTILKFNPDSKILTPYQNKTTSSLWIHAIQNE